MIKTTYNLNKVQMNDTVASYFDGALNENIDIIVQELNKRIENSDIIAGENIVVTRNAETNKITISTEAEIGKQVELQTTDTHIQWKYNDESEWRNLLALEDLGGGTAEYPSDGDNGDILVKDSTNELGVSWSSVKPLSTASDNMYQLLDTDLKNNWTFRENFNSHIIEIGNTGMAVLHLLLKTGTTVNGTIIMQLPSEWLPSSTFAGVGIFGGKSNTCFVEITPSGEVKIWDLEATPSNGTFFRASITYKLANKPNNISIEASDIAFENNNMTSTNTQGAINELYGLIATLREEVDALKS